MKRANSESGFGLVAFMAVLLPLVVLAGSAMMAMGGRSNRLRDEVRQEKALLAAEAGIDEARYRGAIGTLVSGAPFARTLPNGSGFVVEPTHLLTDGKDNDGDTSVDEADEDVFRLIVIGTYGSARRRVAGYLSPVAGATLPIQAAMTTFNPNPQTQIDFNGTGFITGVDTNMDGSPGPAPPVPGLAIQDPATVVDLTANYAVDDDSRITGSSGPPSLGVSSSTLDLNKLVLDVKNNANIVLSSSYIGANWGTAPAGPFNLIHREGDLQLSGTVVGTGILVVTGKLQVADDFRFDGIVIVLGDVQIDDDVLINGAMIQGPSSNQTQLTDNVKIRYSSEAIKAAASALSAALGNYALVTGWQEISRK